MCVFPQCLPGCSETSFCSFWEHSPYPDSGLDPISFPQGFSCSHSSLKLLFALLQPPSSPCTPHHPGTPFLLLSSTPYLSQTHKGSLLPRGASPTLLTLSFEALESLNSLRTIDTHLWRHFTCSECRAGWLGFYIDTFPIAVAKYLMRSKLREAYDWEAYDW